MKLKNILALASLAGIASTGLTGCGKSDPFAGTTRFTLWNFVGTLDNVKGTKWIYDAASRFEALNEETEFEPGKKGVHIDIEGERTLKYDYRTFEYGADIYIDEYRAKINELAGANLLLDISDIAEEINATTPFDPGVVDRLKGPDGKYYALPQYEYFAGPTYDKDAFDEGLEDHPLYFADEDEDNVDVFKCAYGTGRFISTLEDEKSAGPDGVKGTIDDGLPSSLQELCILFSLIKKYGNPIVLGGERYEFLLVMALWSALAGKDSMGTAYANWDEEGGTKVRVVKYDSNGKILLKDVDAFGNTLNKDINQIVEPVTEEVSITTANGYLMHETVERYYALSFLELCRKNQWFNRYYETGSASTYDREYSFVVGDSHGKNYVLLDGTYWYHEAESKDIFEDYKKLNPDAGDRNVQYMPLPIVEKGSVKVGEGEKQALLDLGSSMLFATKRAADSEGKLAAVKAFLKFIYSEAELAHFTELTGMTVPMTYSYDASKVDIFDNSLIAYKNASEVVRYSSNHVAFRKYQDKFGLSWGSPLIGLTINNVDYMQSGYMKMLIDNIPASTIFTGGRMSEGVWKSLQQ